MKKRTATKLTLSLETIKDLQELRTAIGGYVITGTCNSLTCTCADSTTTQPIQPAPIVVRY